MAADTVMQDYKNKTRQELRITSAFTRDARRELRKGNFKIAMAQALEAERHIQDIKNLLREMNRLNEMERSNANIKRAIRLAQEINDKDRQLAELEKQLTQVKEAAKMEAKPGPEEEKEEEYKIEV